MTTSSEHNGGRLAPWRAELGALLTLGIPMALTQLVQFSIQTVDVLMIGRLGAAPLGAAALGMVIYWAMFIMGMGPAIAISPLVSQALGANSEDFDDVRRSVRMGLWLTVLMFPLAFAFFYFSGTLALALGQPPELVTLAEPYVLVLAPGLPFMLGVLILRNFLAAIEKTRMPLLFIVLTTVFNAWLNYLLIFGNWGFPRLELVGAGIASALSHAAGFALLVLYINRDEVARRFQLFRQALVPDWPRLREVTRLGLPISITLGFEMMLFNAMVLIVGRIGVDEVAAYQVTLNVAALGFMTALGLSMAGGVRVGLAAGARDAPRVRRASIVTFVCCIAAIMSVAIPVMIAPRAVAGLYLDASDPANATVIALVASFLPIAAGFALFDASQVAANQCLRGLKDVRAPMYITGFSYWVVGFPLAAWWALRTPMGAIGVWWALMVSLLLASLMLGGRLAWLVGRLERS